MRLHVVHDRFHHIEAVRQLLRARIDVLKASLFGSTSFAASQVGHGLLYATATAASAACQV